MRFEFLKIGKWMRPICNGIVVFIGSFFVLSVVWVLVYKWVNPPVSNLMLLRSLTSKEASSLYNLRHTWAPFDAISPHIIHAALLGEDLEFYTHKGVNFSLLKYALVQDLKGETVASSTITQQTAKNLFLYPKKTYFRKALEVYFSFLMEGMWGKNRILEVYLNIIELGKGCYGISKGAEVFFSKTPQDICFDEACLMIGALPNPRKMDISHPSNALIYRASHLYNLGYRQACYVKYPSLNSGRRTCFPVL